jgi:hypothetical protein
MSNNVFLKDYLDFLHVRAAEHQKIIDDTNAFMRKNQELHEKSFWYEILFKKFGWKSFSKYEYSPFDVIFDELAIAENYLAKYKIEIDKITYYRKTLEIMMCEDIDTHVVDCNFPKAFYEWARNNGRPSKPFYAWAKDNR